MDYYKNTKDFPGFRIRKKIVDICEGRHTFQTVVPSGPHGIQYGDSDDDDIYEADWVPEVKRNSDAEKKSQLLQEIQKNEEKAEKKRLKKQRQKQRKQLEKLEKEAQNPGKSTEESNMEENNEFKEPASNEIDSSGSGSGSGSEEHCADKEDEADSADDLDMSSTFVNVAARRVQRKLEQRASAERREKRSPAKGEARAAPGRAPRDPDEVGRARAPTSPFRCEDAGGGVSPSRQDSESSHSLEENIKMSTHLATIGNKYATTGAFTMAVKCFTNAIQYNPKEYKLFGNRSFCFEKMQEYEKALADAELSLTMCPGWIKGLFRKGRALAGLKRYKEASKAFQDVLKLDCSYAEAAQELIRAQTFELMSHGFSQEESLNALIIHGAVEEAREVLTKLTKESAAVGNGTSSPVRGASDSRAPARRPAAPTRDAPAKSEAASPPPLTAQEWRKSSSNSARDGYKDKEPQLELFPIWVGNLVNPVSEETIFSLFSGVGVVHSVKVLTYKRCAFVNYTKRLDCDKAIWDYNGYILNENKLAVRYPDRIPQGMGMSKSAIRAEDIKEEHYGDQAHGNHYRRTYRPNRRGFCKY